jgi:hypothetical protein
VKAGADGLDLKTAFTDITAASDAGKWKVVFFWPKDFTFVCPTEIVAFGKLAGDFADRDAAPCRRRLPQYACPAADTSWRGLASTRRHLSCGRWRFPR